MEHHGLEHQEMTPELDGVVMVVMEGSQDILVVEVVVPKMVHLVSLHLLNHLVVDQVVVDIQFLLHIEIQDQHYSLDLDHLLSMLLVVAEVELIMLLILVELVVVDLLLEHLLPVLEMVVIELDQLQELEQLIVDQVLVEVVVLMHQQVILAVLVLSLLHTLPK